MVGTTLKQNISIKLACKLMNDQHTLVKHMKLHKHDHPFPLIL